MYSKGIYTHACMPTGYKMQATTCTLHVCERYVLLRNCNPEPKLWLRTPNKRRGKAATPCMVMILKCYRLLLRKPCGYDVIFPSWNTQNMAVFKGFPECVM